MYFALSSSKSGKAGANIKESAIKRSLASVTKVDVSGIPVNEPPSVDTSIGFPFLEAEIQLPSCLLSSWFCLPPVFSPSGWVVRKLEPVKIAAACDVPPSTAKAFHKGCLSKELLPGDIVKLPPLKVVQSTFAAVFMPPVDPGPNLESIGNSDQGDFLTEGKLMLSSFGGQVMLCSNFEHD